MKLLESEDFVHFRSPWLAAAFARHKPMIAHFGVESGGRSRCHLESNLLKPGIGGRFHPRGGEELEVQFSHSEAGVAYASGASSWSMHFSNERTLVLRFAGRMEERFFSMAFAPAVAPVTVWGRWLGDSRAPYHFPKPIDIPDVSVKYTLPVSVHFPSFGRFSITSSSPHVRLCKTMSADKGMSGLNLGWSNGGAHTTCVAYHHGIVELAFEQVEPAEEIELTFRVEDELVPVIGDFSDPKWNGLRRCWQNAFTLHPPTMTMGDNPVLSGVAHMSVHYKSDMSVFTPPFTPDLSVHDVLRRQLDITFGECVGPNGEINARYRTGRGLARHGRYEFFDSSVSNPIALYNYVAATGDWSLVERYKDNLCRTARFLMGFDQDGDGILEFPYDGNTFRDDREYRNWWDNFSFGHKDGFLNLLAYRALGNLAELLENEDRPDVVGEIENMRTLFARNFHAQFFNPETGVYAGWISADGRKHDYMFTFIAAMAINEGLVEQSVAEAMLSILLAKLRKEGYGNWKWGIPGPLLSVSESDGHIWHRMQDWGFYENGGLCGQTAYHFIQALYRTGMRDIADEILFRMMDTFENERTHAGVFPGYMGSPDWRSKDGIPCGYNYLADNYYFLLAAITGHMRVEMPKVSRAALANA
jgi:hypothetical protein